jgi:hypothetical protein
MASTTIQDRVGGRELRTHLVLIIGSRQLLVWDIDGNGEWTDGPVFV